MLQDSDVNTKTSADIGALGINPLPLLCLSHASALNNISTSHPVTGTGGSSWTGTSSLQVPNKSCRERNRKRNRAVPLHALQNAHSFSQGGSWFCDTSVLWLESRGSPRCAGKVTFPAGTVGRRGRRAEPGPPTAQGRCVAVSKDLAPFQCFQVASPKSEGIWRQIPLKFFH